MNNVIPEIVLGTIAVKKLTNELKKMPPNETKPKVFVFR